jgi:hypothetical protein
VSFVGRRWRLTAHSIDGVIPRGIPKRLALCIQIVGARGELLHVDDTDHSITRLTKFRALSGVLPGRGSRPLGRIKPC